MITLRIDLHVHTQYSPDSLTSPARLIDRCVATGIECVAITDHNTISGALQIRDMAQIPVIIGEEIGTRDGEIIGLFLKEVIPRDLSAVDTVKLIKDQGGLVSIPHPFDHFRRSVINPDALDSITPYIDIIEVFNARNTLDSDNERAYQMSVREGIIGSAVTDSHTLIEIGRSYVDIDDFDGTPYGLMSVLRNGKLVKKKINPLIHVVTTVTKLRKRLVGFNNRD